VYYSRELKPYSLDLLVAVLAPLLALDALAPPRSPADAPARRWSWPGLLVLLVATPWIAFGGVFAVGGALAACARGAWPRGRAARLLAACGLFGISLAMAYGTVLRTQAANPRLRESWAEPMAAVSALPWPSAAGHGLAEYGAVSVGYLFGGAWPLAVALMALGAWRWPAPGRATLGWLFGATAGLAVTAALTGHYVLAHGRFLLFAAPAVILLAAAGAVESVRALAPARLAARAPAFAVALCALVTLASAYQAIRYRLAPPEGARPDFRQDVLQDLEPVIAQAARVAGPGEPVLTSRYSGEQFRFYAHGRLPEATVCTRVECRDEGAALSRWLPTVSRRGWIILLAEEDRPGRRGDLRQAGFDVEVAGWARGARLWRLTRRP